MPRAKKTSEDEAEPKSVRRTRQTLIIPDSPVRRSTRNKPAIVDSSPESIIESKSVKRVTRKKSPTPDLELSQTTRNLRKRNVKSESETPSTPTVARVTRRTRASSVALEETSKVETSKSRSKKPLGTPVKGRRRLVSVPVEPSLIEEDRDDFEASEKSSDDKQNSSHESSEKTDDDQHQEFSSTSKKEEIEESTNDPVEDSIIIVEEVNGVNSIIKKKEKYTGIEKRLMNRMLASKLNYSNNESLNGSEINEVSEVEFKNERGSSKEEIQVANLENHEASGKEDLQEKLEIEEEVVKEKTPRKSPRKSSGRKSSLEKKSSGKEDDNNGFNNGENSHEISDERESPFKKEKTPYKEKTPIKEETPNKNQTPIKNETPNKIPTPNKSKTPKKSPTPSKRFSNEAAVDEGTGFMINSKTEDYVPEPMEVDISDPQIDDVDCERDIETFTVPEKMSRDFKPRKSMIEVASEKILMSKQRFSLGNKNPEFIDFSIQKEKKRRKSKGIDSKSDDFELQSLIKDIPSENSPDQVSSNEKRSSLEKRKSTSEMRKSSSGSLSDRPASFQLQVTPDKDELSNSKEKILISNLIKSSEKKSRKRKRESSESDESYQFSVPENEEESFAKKDELDTTLTEENTDEDIETPRNANEYDKESESEERNEKKTPKSLLKKRLSKEFKDEDAAEEKKKPPKKDKSLMSMSLEEGELSNSEADNVNSEDEEELLKSDESFVENKKRRSKSKSFHETETKMEEKEEKEISKSRKSLDNNRSMSSSLEYGTEFEAKAESSLEKSSGKKKNEEESESEDDKKNKPVVKNIEIFQDNDFNNSLVQRLKDNYERKLVLEKTPKKLNKSQTDEMKLTGFEAAGESDSSQDELTDEDSIETVKRARKSKSIGTTPSLSPLARLNKLKDPEKNGKKSKFGKKNEEDSSDESSKIPFFMFSQTSSENESENDEEGSAEEGSKSIDSDIAKEYNLDGKTISRYSDDDVPADNCRGSETEHSDSDDNGSDLADFVVEGSEEDEEDEEEIEDEEESDDSVFDHQSGKSRKVSRPEVKKLVSDSKEENDDGEQEEEKEEAEEEELQKEPSPSKFTETRRSRNSSSKILNLDEENEIKEQEIQLQQHEEQFQQLEVQIHDQENKLEELEAQYEDLEIQDREEKKSPEKVDKLIDNLCSDSESQNSVNEIENTKKSKKLKKKKGKGKEESKTENQSGNSEKQRKKNDVKVEETSKNKKSKRELKVKESKIPMASSTRYEATSDSEEEPETLSFADAKNKVLEANKKKSENLKAGKESKKKKKTEKEGKKVEEAKVEVNSGNIKRLPDELIDDLEEVPRPKKRQKVSKKNDFVTPSLGMHDRRYSVASKSKSLVSASECGSTTDFQVVSIQPKEKKQKPQSSLALKWFKQRMTARNIRQPISVYLSQQQKKRAADKDHF